MDTGIIFQPPAAQLLNSLLVLLLLGVVCTVIAHILFIEGMRTLSAQSVSVVAEIETVFGVFYPRRSCLTRSPHRTLLGGVLILGTVFIPSRLPLLDRKHSGASLAVRQPVGAHLEGLSAVPSVPVHELSE